MPWNPKVGAGGLDSLERESLGTCAVCEANTVLLLQQVPVRPADGDVLGMSGLESGIAASFQQLSASQGEAAIPDVPPVARIAAMARR